jgi:uncharacterized protein (TIGR03067 family)
VREEAACVEEELAKLQGAWRQVYCEADGVEDPPDDIGIESTTTIEGYAFTVRAPDGAIVLEGKFSLDASRDPKAIDWIDSIGPDAGKVLPASYAVDRERFTFVAGAEGAPRPTSFATKPGETLRCFVRLAGPVLSVNQRSPSGPVTIA